ncbi:MAG: pilus assembly protein PilB [Candidatus Marinimicrobia bacterium]|nr:pilus assembly protein PilB [Candidatus Neomarinimicrobiota bacterium]|tara:strand:+ start:41020 stop:42741 length:1722 start_codon:yes stop_codon:yes gene_type:complete
MSNFNPQFQRIGDILVYNKAITQENLERALSEQKTTNEKLGPILLKLGFVSETDLINAYSQQMGHRVVDVEEILKANLEVTALLSEDFAKEKRIIAVSKSEHSIVVVMEDPEDISTLDAVKKLTNSNPEILISSKSDIDKALDILYGKIKKSDEVESAISNISIVRGDEEESDELDLGTEEVSAEDAPFVKLVNLILMEAIKEGSTDIHIEPGREEVNVRIRIDGVLVKIMSPPSNSLNGIVARIKILSKLNIAEHRLPQDGRMKIKTKERDIDVRVSILPTVHGEKIVLRLLGSGNKTLTLQNLGFPDKKLKIFRKWINQPYGMVIISGPTGSGKSTTLYASLMEIMNESVNITTVEDPVEYQIPGINQVQMHDDIGLNFSASLRSILRQDPDVLLIGEIRDKETADIAVKFSLTGHLVFSTVHANDAPSTITRLLDLGIAPFLLGSSLNLIMAQRLVRTIDENAKEEYTPTSEELSRINLSSQDTSSMKFFRGKPTTDNHQTGYKGRTAIHEILEVNNEIRQLIYDGSSQNEIKKSAVNNGMTSLRDAGIEKVKTGISTIDEVLRATVEDI